MRPKSFLIIFITRVYTIDVHTIWLYGISQRHPVFRVYVIHSNWLHIFFFFMIGYGENGYLYAKMWAKMTKN